MDDTRQKYLLVKHPLGYGPKCTLFFVAMFGMSLGQAAPEAVRLVRLLRNGHELSALRWDSGVLTLSALALCFWVSQLRARIVYEAARDEEKAPASREGEIVVRAAQP